MDDLRAGIVQGDETFVGDRCIADEEAATPREIEGDERSGCD